MGWVNSLALIMFMDSKVIIFLLFLAGVFFLVRLIRKKFKVINLPCAILVSGELKTGKTFLSVHLAIREIRKARFWWRVKKVLYKIFFKELSEDDKYPPMLYSNLALAGVLYNPLTLEIIKRQVRIPNKSVVLIDEISLLADSMLYKDELVNSDLTKFFKLYGHYSHGGKLICNTQSLGDNHFSVKRCLGTYLWIYSREKYPFITVLNAREMRYSDDNGTMNVFNEDIELSMRKIFVFNGRYRDYDCYALSVFTDFLPYEVNYESPVLTRNSDLKTYKIVSLNKYILSMNKDIEGKYPQTTYVIDDEGVVNDESSQA